MPTLATVCFFIITPHHFDFNQVYLIIWLIFLLSYILPLMLLIYLKRYKLISDYDIKTVNERKIPLLIFMLIGFILGIYMQYLNHFNALRVIFFGSLFSLSGAYLLTFMKIKTSLHLIGISGLLTYIILLNFYFNLNLSAFTALLIFLTGVLATARLVLKAHTSLELFVGFIFGASGVLLSAVLFLK